jgi:RecJ-like exonuclease
MNKCGLGIAIGIGNREIFPEVQEVFGSYKKTLAKYIEWVTSTPNAVEELEHIYVINGMDIIDEKMVGPITSILLSSGIFLSNKPLISYTSSENEMVKFSSRTKKSEVNMGIIFQKASSQFKGSGGGHDVAAGAQLPKQFAQEFIQLVDQMVGSTQSS